jgi:hypothetical protein
MRSIKWTGSRGQSIELRGCCKITMVDRVVDLDGDRVVVGKEAKTEANLELWVDGIKKDSCWNTAFWTLIDTEINGKAVKKIWGLPVMMDEEQAVKVEAFLTDILENGKGEDVKKQEENEKEQEEAAEMAEAQSIIEEAETTPRNADGTLMTQAQAKNWKTRYNNLHNEGGDGYVPTVITVEAVRQAESVLARL